MRETYLEITELKDDKLNGLLKIRFDNFDKLPAVGDSVFLPKQYWVIERHFNLSEKGVDYIELFVQDHSINNPNFTKKENP